MSDAARGSSRQPSNARVLAKVVLITKDEYDSIADFLAFYSELFGAENVTVVDNGSTDQRVLHVYAAHRAAGGEVVIDTRPFGQAAHFMTEHMRRLAPACEFLLPLETDEFLFLPRRERHRQASGGTYATSRTDVHAALRALPPGVSVVRYSAVLGSRPPTSLPTDTCHGPVRRLTRFFNQGWDKVIVRAAAFDRVTRWSHSVAVTWGATTTSPDMALLHFHDTGPARRFERGRAVSEAMGFIIESDATAPLINVAVSRALFERGVLNGHRLGHYLLFAWRRALVELFHSMLGRLPGHDELGRLADATHGPLSPEGELLSDRPMHTGDMVVAARILLDWYWDEAERHRHGRAHAWQTTRPLPQLAGLPRSEVDALVYVDANPTSSAGDVEVLQVAAALMAIDESRRGSPDDPRNHPHAEVYLALFGPMRPTARRLLCIDTHRDHMAATRLLAELCPAATLLSLVSGLPLGQPGLSECGGGEPVRISVRHADAYAPDTLRVLQESIVAPGTGYDVIIDRGAGSLDEMLVVASGFGQMLAPTGTLVIESVPVPDWIPKILAAFPTELRPCAYALHRPPPTGGPDDILVVLERGRRRTPIPSARFPAPTEALPTLHAPVARHSSRLL